MKVEQYMSIENIDLDDKSFQQLVEEARKKISQISNQWTNLNISDPGITLLELFAFLTDNQIYVLNKITKSQYLKFLKLLGIIPKEASLPKVELSLFSKSPSPETTSTSCNTTFLPKGTRLISRRENLFLETDEDICFNPSLRLQWCVTFSNDQIFENDLSNVVSYDDSTIGTVTSLYSPLKHSVNKSNSKSILKESKKPFFYIFGPNAEENSSFCLCLEYESDGTKKDYQKEDISLYFGIYDLDLPPIGIHGDEHLSEFLDESFYSVVKWEYTSGNIDINGISNKRNFNIFGTSNSSWSPLELSNDYTNAFTQSGKIHFKIPSVEVEATRKITIWIRATLIKNNSYFVPPRLESVLCNTVSCAMGLTIEQTLKNRSPVLSRSKWIDENPGSADLDVDPSLLSNGLANQVFEVDDFTLLPMLAIESLKLQYHNKDYNKDSEEWKRVNDFDLSRPFDDHYIILDKKNGVIKFGDGENGKIPQIGTKIIIKYKTGNLENNLVIHEGKAFELDSYSDSAVFSPDKLQGEIFGVTLLPSSLGNLDEGLKEAVLRGRQELFIPFKVVSKSDCEYIVTNTPGLRVGKVKVFTNDEIKWFPSFITTLEKSKGRIDFVTLDEPENLINTLFVLVIPYTFSQKPMPNIPFLSTILKHLDKHKLITTRIKMVLPEYVNLSITAEVRVKNQTFDKNQLKQKIYDVLEHSFRPLPHSFEDKEFTGWDYGKGVYKSEVISIIENIDGIDMVLDVNLESTGSYGSFSKDEEGNIHPKNSNMVMLNDIDISFT